MSTYRRYAIYWLPEGALARWGEAWLGWDMAKGAALPRLVLPGLPGALEALTRSATTYGCHATIKPPFHLEDGYDASEVSETLAAFCAAEPAVVTEALALDSIDGFLALTIKGDKSAVDALAARALMAFDRFRAPAPPDEFARRRAANLSPRQEGHLARWGYPYVMEDFRFHVTLTDRLLPDASAQVADVIGPQIADLLPRPFVIGGLSLVGQTTTGFRTIAHHAFTG